MLVIKETLRIIFKNKGSFLINLLFSIISALLISISVLSILYSSDLKNFIGGNFKINVFLSADISQEQTNNLKDVLLKKDYVKKVNYISKERAKQIFIQETGEDFTRILDFNPLPESFVLEIKNTHIEKNQINRIIKNLSSLPGVDEVGFKSEVVYKLLTMVENIQNYLFILSIIIFIITLYILFISLKYIILHKQEEYEIMNLVGAASSVIRMPLFLFSISISFFGILTTYLILYNLNNSFSSLIYIDIFKHLNNVLLSGVLIFPLIYLAISFFTLKKIKLNL